MKKITKLLALLLVLLVFSCNKNDDSVKDDPKTTSDSKINLGKEVARNFLGTIVDKNNIPIPDVSITIKDKTAVTDKNGVFIIKEANVNERFAYVKAKKTGFIDASRSVVPTEGANNIKIMMLNAATTATVKSGEASEVKTDDGAIINLDGNFSKEDGTSYSGDVKVTMHFLNPNDENMDSKMPGMLYAENAQQQERMLQTFGMLAVELRGAGGEELNIAKGSKAKMTMPVDASIAANAPATIPLWYFNEDKGYWVEEGQATLQGDKYVGDVSHFSFWNCDIPAEAVTFCLTVTDIDSNPIANARATITSTTYGARGGYTNSDGEVCGLIPKNESLVLTIYNGECGEQAIHTSTVGPYTQDASTSVIVDSNLIVLETITGIFNNCSDNPVTNGYVRIKYGNQLFNSRVNNGNFSINTTRCLDKNVFSIEGFDFDTKQTTGEINYTFTTPNTNIGILKSCDSVKEFIQYTLDGTDNVIFDNIEASLEEDKLFVSANSNDLCYLYADLDSNTTPKYIGTYGAICDPSPFGFLFVECLNMDGCKSPDMQFNLTAIGAVGDYIDFNFNGTYLDYGGNSHTISGTYHVIRDN